MIGTTVGSYRITQKVSVGGMGTVYKAEHTLIGRHAAVKILHPELRSNRDVVNRFLAEAKATTQIKHPGIVEVFDFGYMPSGDGYIVMEFLEGVSLARRLRKGKLPEGKSAMLLKGVCSALAAAHAKKIVHRDLKPDNIFLSPDPDSPTGERAKLLDFGIAKLSDLNLGEATTATKTGLVMGTPTYMSPEQCKGTGGVDHRADLYSLGCIFYEMVTGRPPFEAEGAGELIGMHLYLPPDPPTKYEPSLTPAAAALIMSLLEKDPAKRPQSARELGQSFGAIAQTHGWSASTGPTTGTELPALTDDDDERDLHVPSVAVTPTPAAAHADTVEPVHVTSQPTTLSGAASQSVIRDGGAKKLWIGAIGLMVAAAATVGIVMFTGDKDSPKDTAPAPTAPAAAPTAPAAAPTAPAAAPTTQPAPTPAPSAAPTSQVAAPTPPPTVEPVATPVETPKHDEVKHTVAKPKHVTAKQKPVEQKPVEQKPAEQKPVEKPKDAGSAAPKILIEKDL